MALTTTQLRAAWHPPCKGTDVPLTRAYEWLDYIFWKHDYKPRFGVTGAYNCRRITGGSGYSLHAYGPNGIYTFWTNVRVSKALAVDVNWDRNPYSPVLITDMPPAMIREIKALRTNNGKQVWRWGGDYINNKDAMHFEIVCTPADLATGIDGPKTPPAQPHHSKDDKVYALVQRALVDSEDRILGPADDHWWWTDWNTYRYIDSPKEAGRLVFRVRANGGQVETASGAVAPVLVPAADIDSMQRTA